MTRVLTIPAFGKLNVVEGATMYPILHHAQRSFFAYCSTFFFLFA